jgi:mannose-1-phosphate guanylyltransferase
MSHVQTAELRDQLERADSNHHELLSEGSLTVEVARYASGVPSENTHDEDELYYVVSGSGTLRVEDETYRVEPEDVVFVERGRKHGFVEVDEELTVLVVFGGSSSASYSGTERANA